MASRASRPIAPRPSRGADSLAAALARDPAARVLDVRDAGPFALGHLAGAGRMSLAEFGARRVELPSRLTPVLVVHARPDEARAAAEALAASGYERVQWLARPLAEEPAGLASREPPARLWSASAFLERVIGRCPPGRALDVAAGSGRAAVQLALLGWEVEAWDVDARALAIASEFATREGVRIVTRERDLEAGALERPEPPFDVVVVVRYLHR